MLTMKQYDIVEATNLLNSMQAEEAKYKKLAELAMANLIDVIKNNVCYAAYDNLIPKAGNWLEGKGERDDEMYARLLTEMIEEKLTGRTVDIATAGRCGYAPYAHLVKFTCDGHKFHLEVPIIANFTAETASYAGMGKIYLGMMENDSVISYICSSYDEDEIKSEFARLAGCGYDMDKFENEMKVRR